jgi:hypothetical protein
LNYVSPQVNAARSCACSAFCVFCTSKARKLSTYLSCAVAELRRYIVSICTFVLVKQLLYEYLSCAVAELRRDIVTEKRAQLVACSAFCVSICTFVPVKREKRALVPWQTSALVLLIRLPLLQLCCSSVAALLQLCCSSVAALLRLCCRSVAALLHSCSSYDDPARRMRTHI